MNDFEERLKASDLALFEKINSQSTEHDKRSLLACQLAVRELAGNYKYLEIGSYLGGSIQPHLMDEKCERIFSLDKRPDSQPDARGYDWVYQNNSTARMIELLKEVAEDTGKITTIDGDTREIKPDTIDEKVDLCFIDGEHTDEAVISDFKFCLEALNAQGAIMFHDSQITYNGIAAAVEYLEHNAIKFHAYILPSVLFVIEIGEFPLHAHPQIARLLVDNHQSYLFSLQDNDKYRQFATRFPFGAMRRMLIKLRGTNISE